MEDHREFSLKRHTMYKDGFKNRKNGLMKKVGELSTLCGLDACLIIYGSKTNSHSGIVEPETFPKDHNDVKQIIKQIKARGNIDGIPDKKKVDFLDFLSTRRKKLEEEYENLKKNHESKNSALPTWYNFMENFSEDQLERVMNVLSTKNEVVKKKIDAMIQTRTPDLVHGNYTQLGQENYSTQALPQGNYLEPETLCSGQLIMPKVGNNIDHDQHVSFTVENMDEYMAFYNDPKHDSVWSSFASHDQFPSSVGHPLLPISTVASDQQLNETRQPSYMQSSMLTSVSSQSYVNDQAHSVHNNLPNFK